jgi:ribose transport system permease protein
MESSTPMDEMQAKQKRLDTSNVSDFFWRLFRAREFTLVAMIILMGIVLHLITGGFFVHFNLAEALSTGKFFRTANINAMTLGFATSAIIVFGMTAALASGGFDLSVGSVFALGGVTVATALRAGLSIPVSMLCGVAVGALAGLANGLLITKAKINPFITTLGMMSIGRGVSLAITEGSVLARLPAEFAVFGQGKTFFNTPNLILIAFFVILVGDILMRRSGAFRQIYYVGGNEEAARLSGINVDRVKIGVFVLSGFLAALAGVLSVSRFTVADPGAGIGEELRIIAACIIGGCSLKGGKGTVIGGLFGLIFVGIVNNGLILLRVPIYWQQLSMGVVLLLAVGFDTLSQHWQQIRLRGGKAG